MTVRILVGDWVDVLRTLPAASVHCVVTSPPYFGLRDYGTPGQLGLERTVDEYVARLVEGFREVRRVMRDDATCWVNLGDSYAANRSYQVPDNKWGDVGNNGSMSVPAGLKPKDLIGVPWRVAFALQADGWWLRSDIVWSKPNPMPESVTDRPTKAHEYMFLLTKSARYFFDQEAVREEYNLSSWTARTDMSGDTRRGKEGIRSGQKGRARADGAADGTHYGASSFQNGGYTAAGRNIRSVWTIATQPCPLAHFATFPPALVEPCIKAGTSQRGACPQCGAPWVRVTESGAVVCRGGSNVAKLATDSTATSYERRFGHALEQHAHTTTGWRPSCECNAGEPVACTVLDPFFGAGTTGLVADRLQRDCIGIELSAAYAALAEKRIAEDAGPLIADVQTEHAQMEMFT